VQTASAMPTLPKRMSNMSGSFMQTVHKMQSGEMSDSVNTQSVRGASMQTAGATTIKTFEELVHGIEPQVKFLFGKLPMASANEKWFGKPGGFPISKLFIWILALLTVSTDWLATKGNGGRTAPWFGDSTVDLLARTVAVVVVLKWYNILEGMVSALKLSVAPVDTSKAIEVESKALVPLMRQISSHAHAGGAWVDKHYTSSTFDTFISYRVDPDADTAMKVWKQMTTAHPTLTSFIDKECLNDGESWKTGFLSGLAGSRVIVLLISRASLLRTRKAHETEDNVLLEWEKALRMASKKDAQVAIMPVLLSDEHGNFGGRGHPEFPNGGFDTSEYEDQLPFHGTDGSGSDDEGGGSPFGRALTLAPGTRISNSPQIRASQMRDIEAEEAYREEGRRAGRDSVQDIVTQIFKLQGVDLDLRANKNAAASVEHLGQVIAKKVAEMSVSYDDTSTDSTVRSRDLYYVLHEMAEEQDDGPEDGTPKPTKTAALIRVQLEKLTRSVTQWSTCSWVFTYLFAPFIWSTLHFYYTAAGENFTWDAVKTENGEIIDDANWIWVKLSRLQLVFSVVFLYNVPFGLCAMQTILFTIESRLNYMVGLTLEQLLEKPTLMGNRPSEEVLFQHYFALQSMTRGMSKSWNMPLLIGVLVINGGATATASSFYSPWFHPVSCMCPDVVQDVFGCWKIGRMSDARKLDASPLNNYTELLKYDCNLPGESVEYTPKIDSLGASFVMMGATLCLWGFTMWPLIDHKENFAQAIHKRLRKKVVRATQRKFEFINGGRLSLLQFIDSNRVEWRFASMEITPNRGRRLAGALLAAILGAWSLNYHYAVQFPRRTPVPDRTYEVLLWYAIGLGLMVLLRVVALFAANKGGCCGGSSSKTQLISPADPATDSPGVPPPGPGARHEV